MPRWPWLLLVLGLLVPFVLPRSGRQVQAGPAPELRGELLDGGRFDLAAQAGRVVVLNFWATWCGPCVVEIPELAAFAADHPEVVLVGVSVDRMPPERLRAEARRRGVTYPVLHDPRSEVADRFGVTMLPTTFVIGPEGRIVARVSRPLSRRDLERLVAEAG